MYLTQLIAVRGKHLADRRRQNRHHSDAEEVVAEYAVWALDTELRSLELLLRGAWFKLLASGISHAAYVTFLERLDGPCCEYGENGCP
ncbi:MAG: hypothetical protein CTY34_02000 [Methylobacter sp.]|nr:MAG: hypothetical protein CTY34_02000 [Methylobacter sp.]